MKMAFRSSGQMSGNNAVKCGYCNVEIDFSESMHVKIPNNNTGEPQKFSVYHKGCYERYMRRNA